MFAIITTGGKQYKVTKGDTLEVERLPDAKPDGTVTFEQVLLIGGSGAPKIGTPYIEKASVTAKVLEHGKGKKVTVVKYKPKTRYLRTKGHRQQYTKVSIEKITG